MRCATNGGNRTKLAAHLMVRPLWETKKTEFTVLGIQSRQSVRIGPVLGIHSQAGDLMVFELA